MSGGSSWACPTTSSCYRETRAMSCGQRRRPMAATLMVPGDTAGGRLAKSPSSRGLPWRQQDHRRNGLRQQQRRGRHQHQPQAEAVRWLWRRSSAAWQQMSSCGFRSPKQREGAAATSVASNPHAFFAPLSATQLSSAGNSGSSSSVCGARGLPATEGPGGLAGLAVGRRWPHRGSPLPFGGPAAVLPTSLISKCPGEDVVSRDGHGHDAYVARALTLA